MKKIDFSGYKIKQCTEKESKLASWQDYALSVCKDFNIAGVYKKMIFKYCKQNLQYVIGKVENTKEKFGTGKLEERGHYLISLFRNKKPWE